MLLTLTFLIALAQFKTCLVCVSFFLSDITPSNLDLKFEI